MLIDLLKEKGMTVYMCSKKSGIPYSTLLDIINGKTSIEKCSLETAFKLSKALDVDIEYLLQNNDIDDFETFRSNVKHMVKEKGDYLFIIETLMSDEIEKYWNSFQKAKALYLLATIDYLSRINNLPISEEYDEIRQYSFSQTIKPIDILLLEKINRKVAKENYEKNIIPEFARFNILESNIRDVA